MVLQILCLWNIFILFYSERQSGITLEQNRVRCGAFWAIFHTLKTFHSLNIWLLKSWNKYLISWLPFHVDFKNNLITLESLSLFFCQPIAPPPPPSVVTPLVPGDVNPRLTNHFRGQSDRDIMLWHLLFCTDYYYWTTTTWPIHASVQLVVGRQTMREPFRSITMGRGNRVRRRMEWCRRRSGVSPTRISKRLCQSGVKCTLWRGIGSHYARRCRLLWIWVISVIV